MMFAKCTSLYGEANVLNGQPQVRTHYDVVLDEWALYDRSRRMIPDSAYYRGVPNHTTIGGSSTSRIEQSAIVNCMPDQDFFWLGPFHVHFGHFIVNTLARAWAITSHTTKDTSIVYVAGLPPADLFRIGFIRDCMEALGVTQDRLVQVGGPLRFPKITVAEQVLTENFSIYTRYFEMVQSIGNAVKTTATLTERVSDAPVYVSKQRVLSGVRTVLNEDELTDALQRRGIEVAFPDTMPFPDQLAFWSQKKTVFGFASSAFHLAGFFGEKRLCTINHGPKASTNQIMLDEVSNNINLHLHAEGGIIGMGRTEQFFDSVKIADPVGMADDLTRLTESYGRLGVVSAQLLPPRPRSLCRIAFADEPFGTNLAINGVAIQSSTYAIQEGHHREPAGAISGRLTGAYQCHTASELNPWWQIELLEVSSINEIRIYNRCDNPVAQARLQHLSILFSMDSITWETIAPPTGNKQIGGLHGELYRWRSHRHSIARFVRLQLSANTYLHFDQIEIFGEPDQPL